MEFEFDPAKSASNKEKHGLDFEEAKALWKDDGRVEFDVRSAPEPRMLMVGLIGQKLWTAVFTWREGRVRLISVRRARTQEAQRYDDENDRRS
jgi:uncharacterized DUF497 family protein